MKCENARDLFSEYSERTLSPAMKLALEQHFSSCEDCRTDYEAFQQVSAILSQGLPQVEAPAGFRQSIMARVAAEQASAPAAAAPRPRAASSPLDGLGRAWRNFTLGLTSTPRGAFATGAACMLLAVTVYAGLHSFHGSGAVGPIKTQSGSLIPPTQL
ncbi:MAG TPA: zf-HC2 domain-containing protein, partial [Capsulimonadaceae bacterium]|nr:zf-HC2 domain-containing protein [Capsulimonadaceae bacterium]